MSEGQLAQTFAALYVRTKPGLLRWCQRKVGRWDAEDLYHDGIVAAWHHWRTGEVVRNPEAWLRGILWHVLQQRQRQRAQRSGHVGAVRWWYVHDRALLRDTRHLEIREALLRIPHPERASLVHYGMGETGDELAQRFHTSRTTQVVQVKRARERLAH